MMNRMTWETNDFELFLEVDVRLDLTLEVVIAPLNFAYSLDGRIFRQLLFTFP